MDESTPIVTCTHCGKSWDKKQLDRSCSNCFACTACEAYICPECRYEIVITPPRPMKRSRPED